jgi:hypothetical protein
MKFTFMSALNSMMNARQTPLCPEGGDVVNRHSLLPLNIGAMSID